MGKWIAISACIIVAGAATVAGTNPFLFLFVACIIALVAD